MPCPHNFAANVSWLFPEMDSLLQRVDAAACAGFQAVEVAWPYDTEATELNKTLEKYGMELVLINTPPGNKERGELGLGADPKQRAEFRRGLDQAVQYAKAVHCKRIHLMAGRVPTGLDRTTVAMEMEATFVENLKYAADVLSKDLFHWQIMDGNLTQNITNYFPLIGHVQVAQVPNRNEPDSPGEINYSYIFKLLETLGYQGYIGCEYAPKGNTIDGLGWLRTQWTEH
ncbi:putative hydroxypyruvate isomerase isoform X2 [Leucoraja erinacea]|uniref:putative hydroxypyruvate isomerase isoform X2 n=1 Tax=Leucoraja erinaceus TaxID=7782 RepID=UPI002453A3A2|nr:putative hydroxypyruvate isomerase isoform X2 [Leucoraja erinacea]